MSGVNHAEQGLQIACRLCDQIFMNNRELISHLQNAHMAEDGTVSERPREIEFISRAREKAVFSAHFQSNISFMISSQETRDSIKNNFSLVQNLAASSRNPISISQFDGNFAKPFIDHLEKPIPEIVELGESDDDEKKMDLTLKL